MAWSETEYSTVRQEQIVRIHQPQNLWCMEKRRPKREVNMSQILKDFDCHSRDNGKK